MTSQSQRDEFAAELERVHHQLFGFIFALLRDLEDTQEVYQQTCLAMWEKFDTFERRSEFGTWACGFARNKVMDFRKTRERYRNRFSEMVEEQIAALQMQTPRRQILDRRDALEECVEKLSDADRELVRELYGRDSSVRELADRLGRSAQSVHGSWRRVRQNLMECIDRAVRREEQA